MQPPSSLDRPAPGRLPLAPKPVPPARAVAGVVPRGPLVPRTDTLNRAGGKAYSFSPKHALAQYAATGCLNATFYATAQEDLDKVLELSSRVEPAFLAKTAVRPSARLTNLFGKLCAATCWLSGRRCARCSGPSTCLVAC